MIFTLKILSDMAYFAYYSSFLTAYFTQTAAPMAALLALTLCCGLSYGFREKALAWRLAPFAALLSWLVLIQHWADVLALAPCAAYAVLVCVKKGYFVNVDDFRERFVLWIKIMPVVLVFGLVISRDTLELRSLPFALVYLFTSVFLLRLLRHDESVLTQTRFRILNTFSLIGIAAVGLICSTPLFLSSLVKGIAGLYKLTLAPVLMLIAYLFVFLLYSIGPLINYLKELFARAQEYIEGREPVALNTDPPFYETYQEVMPDNSHILDLVIRTSIVLIIVVVAIIFFRRLLKSRRPTRLQGGVTEQRISLAARDPKKPRAARGPREQVRAVYRKFLNLCLNNGIGLKRDDTSRDILYRIEREPWFGREAEKMREIYLSARYAEGEVTRDDVKAVKEQYAALRSRAKKPGR